MNRFDGAFSNLTHVSRARNGRISSWDQNGKNHDYWLIPPNESVTLGEIFGPGSIRHIWMTSFCRKSIFPGLIPPEDNGRVAPVNEIAPPLGIVWDVRDPDYYRKALLRITWDRQDCPSVLVPFGDFFCIGHSMPVTFNSLPIQVSVNPAEERVFGGAASVSCYFPMPFNEHAKVEIINENDVPFGLYFQIDYELYQEKLGADTAYFHACWKRQLPCEGWGNDILTNSPEINSVSNLTGENNYVLLETEGEGHYAALLRKTGEPEIVKRKYPASMKDKKLLAVYEDFCKEIFIEPKKWTADSTMTMFGDQLYRTPEEMVDFKGLRVLRPGLQMGEFKKNRFEPSHALALALHPSEVKQNVNLSAAAPETAAYLRGETIQLSEEDAGKGWCLVSVDGYSLGWGKKSGGTLKNHYPKGLRKQY